MKKTNFLLAVVVIILVSALILRIMEMVNSDEKEIYEKTEEIEQEIEVQKEKEEKNIKIIQPRENELITSSYKVKGMVPGNWLLETDYYIVLVDKQNFEIIETSIIETEEKWDTYQLVPFFSILEFSDLSGKGIIRIAKMKDGSLVSLEDFQQIIVNYKNP